MTNEEKLEAIKAEIERGKNETFLTASFNECKQFILNKLQKFIASLDKQSDNCDTCTNDKGCVTCKNGELYEGKPTDYEKSNEEKAKEICGKGNPCCNKPCQFCHSYNAAMLMAEWKEQQLIDKACEWLRNVTYFDYGACMFEYGRFIKDFKKAMKGGEE